MVAKGEGGEKERKRTDDYFASKYCIDLQMEMHTIVPRHGHIVDARFASGVWE